MGYLGIDHSVAIKFDDFNFLGGAVGASLTGLFVNGEYPDQPSIDLAPDGIDFQSGHVFLVTMGYDGTTLGVTITDTLTHASATQTYTIDIAVWVLAVLSLITVGQRIVTVYRQDRAAVLESEASRSAT